MNCKFSFIIPVYCEAQIISATIDHIRHLQESFGVEIIVVDGDHAGTTVMAIQDTRILKLLSPKGRARQQNFGAAKATGNVLVFLHADTRLPENALMLIAKVMEDDRYVAGAFDLGIDSGRLIFRIIERMASRRSRITRIPYGDQAIFIRADYFKALGGFRDIPIMEDVEFMQHIKRKHGEIYILKEKVRTSARRWETEGVLYCTLRNWLLMMFYWLGVKPEKLVQFYK